MGKGIFIFASLSLILAENVVYDLHIKIFASFRLIFTGFVKDLLF